MNKSRSAIDRTRRKRVVIRSFTQLYQHYKTDERFIQDDAVLAVLKRLALGDLLIGRTVAGADLEDYEATAKRG